MQDTSSSFCWNGLRGTFTLNNASVTESDILVLLRRRQFPAVCMQIVGFNPRRGLVARRLPGYFPAQQRSAAKRVGLDNFDW
jgi:hypothetical protein